MSLLPTRHALCLLAALASGILLYFATGLHPWWWVAWLAPIPLLIAAFRASHSETRWLAVIAGLIGSTSTTSYYAVTTGPYVAALIMLLRTLSWALVVMQTRAVVLGSRHWFTVFAYPTLWTALDTVVAAISPHSTFGSLAYTQMDALPVIQVASLIGEAGIVFIVSLFASVVSIAWYRKRNIEKPWLAYGLPSAVLLVTLSWGLARLADVSQTRTIPVGLVAVDRPVAALKNVASTGDAIWAGYSDAAANLAKQGAKIIVLPEKIALLDHPAANKVKPLLANIARSNSVYLVVGIALLADDHKENRAWMFTPTGELIADYAKQHLVPGWEAAFTPGKEDVVNRIGANRFGIAICKDMDFPALGRRYKALGADAVLVPARDFDRDAWLHSRMAVLRGVESGFTVIRSAQRGRLTVSDRYGRVAGDIPSAGAPGASLELVASIDLGGITPYARLGDVFGWFCVVISIVILLRSWPWARTPFTTQSSK
jgi:apolipoprotein N-acyltransferase